MRAPTQRIAWLVCSSACSAFPCPLQHARGHPCPSSAHAPHPVYDWYRLARSDPRTRQPCGFVADVYICVCARRAALLPTGGTLPASSARSASSS
eukprot:6987851-Prymnesium_polylepis.2